LPLPLGANAIRNDLDDRFGPGTAHEVVQILHQSIEYALAHREEGLDYAAGFAPEATRDQVDRFVKLYVNDLTVDAGTRGMEAILTLLSEAGRIGLCPQAAKFTVSA